MKGRARGRVKRCWTQTEKLSIHIHNILGNVHGDNNVHRDNNVTKATTHSEPETVLPILFPRPSRVATTVFTKEPAAQPSPIPSLEDMLYSDYALWLSNITRSSRTGHG